MARRRERDVTVRLVVRTAAPLAVLRTVESWPAFDLLDSDRTWWIEVQRVDAVRGQHDGGWLDSRRTPKAKCKRKRR